MSDAEFGAAMEGLIDFIACVQCREGDETVHAQHIRDGHPVPPAELNDLHEQHPEHPCWTTTHLGRPCGPDCLMFRGGLAR